MYICIDGVDGAGKTTIIEHLYNKHPNKENIILTKEPGSPFSEICINIRKLILNYPHNHDYTLGYLFAADAYEHLKSVVAHFLHEGKNVISDRCMLSDFAYRPNIPFKMREENIRIFKNLYPIVILIDAEPDKCFNRMIGRGKLNTYEEDHVIERLPNIRDNYYAGLEFLKSQGVETHIIENNDKIEDAVKKIFNYL